MKWMTARFTDEIYDEKGAVIVAQCRQLEYRMQIVEEHNYCEELRRKGKYVLDT